MRTIVLEAPHTDPLLRPGARRGVVRDQARHRRTRHPSQDAVGDGANLAGQVTAVVSAAGSVGEPADYGVTVARTLHPNVPPYVVGTPRQQEVAVDSAGSPLLDRQISHFTNSVTKVTSGHDFMVANSPPGGKAWPLGIS